VAELEVVPDQLRLSGGLEGAGEDGPVPLVGEEGEEDLLPLVGELVDSDQGAGAKALRPGRAEGEVDLRAAGDCPIGGLTAGVLGIENG
jgi:hypothetical protein